MPELDELYRSPLLVVDDEEANVALLDRLLHSAGFQCVHTETDSSRVLDRIAELDPQCVILDLHMPKPDGFEVLAAIRSRGGDASELPVLVCTADVTTDTMQRALSAGASDFLTKPVDAVEVAQRTRNLVMAHLMRGELRRQNESLEERVQARTFDLHRANDSLKQSLAENQRVAAQLRQTEQRLRFLLTSGPASILALQPFEPFAATFVSDNVRHIVGYEPSDFMAEPHFWSDHVHPEDAIRLRAHWRELPLLERHAEEFRFRHRNGSYRWIHCDCMLVRNASGSPTEVVSAWIDISERKWAEEALAEHLDALEQTNKRLEEYDRMKSEFVATASHEMRTPLTVIREFTSQLAEEVAGKVVDEQRQMLSAVLRNCDRLAGLLDNLLDLRKIEAGKLAPRRKRTELRQILVDCASDFASPSHSAEIDLRVDVPDALPPILCDPQQVSQVLVNLLANALKFTPRGGTITLRARTADGRVDIEVSDTGRGVAADELEAIFEAFRQVDREEGPGVRGTGLGLTISRHIVEMHGSNLTVESTLGEGSTFRFSLPAWDPSTSLEAGVEDLWLAAEADGEPISLLLLRAPEASRAALADRVASELRTNDAVLEAPGERVLAYTLRANRNGAQAALVRLSQALSGAAPPIAGVEYSFVELGRARTASEWIALASTNFKALTPSDESMTAAGDPCAEVSGQKVEQAW